jgi:proton-dependent oligopeptide transporter, POT family
MTNIEVHLPQNPKKSFSLIFSIELWERFGYYGLQALLVTFLARHLKFSDNESYVLFGAFSTLSYGLISLGGIIGDKVLGTKRTMFLGAIVLAIGYLLLGLDPEAYLYWGLGAVISGNMLFKANPSSLVSKLYAPGDHRIDGVFTLYYMAINIGSSISIVLCPFLRDHFGWKVAFMTCGIGLVAAILNYIVLRGVLSDCGSEPDFKRIRLDYLFYTIVITLFVTALSAWLLKHLIVTQIIMYCIVAIIIVIMIKILLSSKNKQEKNNFAVCMILIAQAMIFFILYQQMPTSLNLFAVRNVHHYLLGIPVSGETFQALNPFWILIASPFFAWLYTKLGKKGNDFSMPAKFAFGMFLCSLGFLILPLAIYLFVDGDHMISGNWLIATYGFQSIGEILISGLGLAMISKFVPARIVGFMMGVWFLLSAVARGFLGSFVASFASVSKSQLDHPAQSIAIYSKLFFNLGLAAFAISIIMFLFVPKLKKYIN